MIILDYPPTLRVKHKKANECGCDLLATDLPAAWLCRDKVLLFSNLQMLVSVGYLSRANQFL